MSGFKNFILKGNLVEIAVGLIMALSFAAVVTAFVAWLTSLLPDAASEFFGRAPGGAFGAFLNALISFVLMAAVVYFFVVLPYTKAKEQVLPGAEEGTPADIALLEEIRDALKARGGLRSDVRAVSAVVRRHLVAIPVVALAGVVLAPGRGRRFVCSGTHVAEDRGESLAAFPLRLGQRRRLSSGSSSTLMRRPRGLLLRLGLVRSGGGLGRRLGRRLGGLGRRLGSAGSPRAGWGSRSRTRWPEARR